MLRALLKHNINIYRRAVINEMMAMFAQVKMLKINSRTGRINSV